MFEGPEKKFQRHIAEYFRREHRYAVLEQRAAMVRGSCRQSGHTTDQNGPRAAPALLRSARRTVSWGTLGEGKRMMVIGTETGGKAVPSDSSSCAADLHLSTLHERPHALSQRYINIDVDMP